VLIFSSVCVVLKSVLSRVSPILKRFGQERGIKPQLWWKKRARGKYKKSF